MSLIKLQGNASGTGALTIAAPNTNTDRTLTLPDATGTMVLNEGSGIFKIDTSGNVGIGTSSPGYKLDVSGTGRFLGDVNIYSGAGGAINSSIQYFGSAALPRAAALYSKTDTATAGNLVFATAQSGTGTITERMRIDASGNVLIGKTSVTGSCRFEVERTDNDNSIADFKTNNGSGDVIIRSSGGYVRVRATGTNEMAFLTAGTERARITAGGFLLSGTTSDFGGQFNALGTGRDGIIAQVTSNSNSPYLGKNASGSIIYILSGLGTIYAVNTTVQSVSDVRTKENIKDSTDGLQVVMGLRPRRFDFKAGFGGDRKDVLGFVAQEIEQVFPDAVDLMPSGSAPDDPEEPYKSVGPGALIPVLVKAIQEQQALITALTARVAALEAN